MTTAIHELLAWVENTHKIRSADARDRGPREESFTFFRPTISFKEVIILENLTATIASDSSQINYSYFSEGFSISFSYQRFSFLERNKIWDLSEYATDPTLATFRSGLAPHIFNLEFYISTRSKPMSWFDRARGSLLRTQKLLIAITLHNILIDCYINFTSPDNNVFFLALKEAALELETGGKLNQIFNKMKFYSLPKLSSAP
ncbi:MAG: hypothetical protein A3E87_09170 [Gammaproteobacteria bacterium RIFCSPHIGHO2_12_FULL_35_23]|nr:MAG: hypothetical protein A3E87_09170 [Gammaproteobacteria bacterium RIFCSPHIGHO2_12_FULL_35_23]